MTRRPPPLLAIDDEREEKSRFLRAWRDRFGEDLVSVSDLVALAEDVKMISPNCLYSFRKKKEYIIISVLLDQIYLESQNDLMIDEDLLDLEILFTVPKGCRFGKYSCMNYRLKKKGNGWKFTKPSRPPKLQG